MSHWKNPFRRRKEKKGANAAAKEVREKVEERCEVAKQQPTMSALTVAAGEKKRTESLLAWSPLTQSSEINNQASGSTSDLDSSKKKVQPLTVQGKRTSFSERMNGGFATIEDEDVVVGQKSKVVPTGIVAPRKSLSLDSQVSSAASSLRRLHKDSSTFLSPHIHGRRGSYIFRQPSRSSGCSSTFGGIGASLLPDSGDDHAIITPFAQVTNKLQVSIDNFEKTLSGIKDVYNDISGIDEPYLTEENDRQLCDQIGSLQHVLKLLIECSGELEEMGKQDQALGQIAAQRFAAMLDEEVSDEPGVQNSISDMFTGHKIKASAHPGKFPSRARGFSVAAIHHVSNPLSPSLVHSQSLPVGDLAKSPRTRGATTSSLETMIAKPSHPTLPSIAEPKRRRIESVDYESDDDGDGKTPLVTQFKFPASVRDTPITNPELFQECIANLDSWEFNVFDAAEATNQQPFVPVMMALLEERNLLTELKVDKRTMVNFLSEIELGYKDNPYHNSWHGVDVAQTSHVLIRQGQLEKHLNSFDIFLLLISACAHDVAHPGVNNDYLVLTRDPLALMYNDTSVLENMHASTIFSIAEDKNKDCFIFKNFRREVYNEFRSRCIKMILATDPNAHMSMLGTFTSFMDNTVKQKSASAGCTTDIKEDIMVSHLSLIMEMLLHSADISNPCKPMEVSRKWTDRVVAEFYKQGDLEREKGFEPKSFMDRNQNLARMQMFFIKAVARPQWETWNLFMHNIDVEFNQPLDCLYENLNGWTAEAEAGGSRRPSQSSIPPILSVEPVEELSEDEEG